MLENFSLANHVARWDKWAVKARDIETIRRSVALLQSAGPGDIPEDVLALFQPSKSVHEMTDAEVEDTAGSKVLRNLLGLEGDKHRGLLRSVLAETHEGPIERRITASIDALFATLPASVQELTITPPIQKDGGVVARVIEAINAAERLGGGTKSIIVCRTGDRRYRRVRGEEGGRFKVEDYARFIGRSFKKEVIRQERAVRNGSYELRILPGDPTSKVTTLMSAELHQFPANGVALPVIKFPPAKGERREHRQGLFLRADVEVVEVSAMSQMMKVTILDLPQTPAVFFGLVEELRLQTINPWA